MGFAPPPLATAVRPDPRLVPAATARARTPSPPTGGTTIHAMTKVRAGVPRRPWTSAERVEDEGKEEGLAVFILRS